jgi:hypothetical protein
MALPEKCEETVTISTTDASTSRIKGNLDKYACHRPATEVRKRLDGTNQLLSWSPSVAAACPSTRDNVRCDMVRLNCRQRINVPGRLASESNWGRAYLAIYASS